MPFLLPQYGQIFFPPTNIYTQIQVSTNLTPSTRQLVLLPFFGFNKPTFHLSCPPNNIIGIQFTIYQQVRLKIASK